MTPETLICVFCSSEVSNDYPVCLACNEYKGVMTLSDYRKTYPDFFEDDFGDLEIF